MRLTLHVWRQKGPNSPGKMVRYEANKVDGEMSMLELLDVVCLLYTSDAADE